MRLSRLSNRQLKRLLARGEVRFGDIQDNKEALKVFIKLADCLNDYINTQNSNLPKIHKAVNGTDLFQDFDQTKKHLDKMTLLIVRIIKKLQKMSK